MVITQPSTPDGDYAEDQTTTRVMEALDLLSWWQDFLFLLLTDFHQLSRLLPHRGVDQPHYIRIGHWLEVRVMLRCKFLNFGLSLHLLKSGEDDNIFFFSLNSTFL